MMEGQKFGKPSFLYAASASYTSDGAPPFDQILKIDIENGVDGKRTFEFKNIGNAPLVFSRIFSSCGCTIPKKPEKPIQPGESGIIEVEYDTKRTGLFQKAITVNSNAKTPNIILRIKGEVLPESEEDEKSEKK